MREMQYKTQIVIHLPLGKTPEIAITDEQHDCLLDDGAVLC